jgi:hypothetical protein
MPNLQQVARWAPLKTTTAKVIEPFRLRAVRWWDDVAVRGNTYVTVESKGIRSEDLPFIKGNDVIISNRLYHVDNIDLKHVEEEFGGALRFTLMVTLRSD